MIPPTAEVTAAANTNGAFPRRYMLAMIMWKMKKNRKGLRGKSEK